MRSDHWVLSLLAVIIGLAAAGGVIGFRTLLDQVQLLFHGFSSEAVVTLLAGEPWWRIVLAPAVGGLVVGVMVRYLLPGGPEGVPHVMEASALKGARIPLKTGLMAALVSVVSLGVGASNGREGPAVHLGASIGSQVARRLRLSENLSRTLLGCGVAAAVAGSFNAPFAGVFFALEVVVGHYTLSAFAPIVIASVAATVLTRAHYGNFPAFILPETVDGIVSILEFPAFVLLGIVSAAVAMLFMWTTVTAQDAVDRLNLPRVLRPAIAGLAIGLLALQFPHILGVGYEATDMAIKETLPLALMITLIVLKIGATALCLGAGFGGGVFSPSIFIGAMTGGAFGLLATMVSPELSSGQGAYTLVGMGSVAGAVLGAPISTILIIFEMSGDYKLTIAVMISVVVASTIVEQVIGKSLFTWQLARRGISLRGGRDLQFVGRIRMGDVMKDDYVTVAPDTPLDEVTACLERARYGEVFVVEDGCRLVGVITTVDLMHAEPGQGDVAPTASDLQHRDPPALEANDGLERAINLMEGAGESHLPVVESQESRRLIGFVHEHDVMLAYHRAIVEARARDRTGGFGLATRKHD
ncbi:MAG: chloride channel protein [Rhodospirillaceae bacterium]|nr:chloride channel protein [Rhodospirillaceae bacterium]